MPLSYQTGDMSWDDLGSALRIAAGVCLAPAVFILLGFDNAAASAGRIWGLAALILVLGPALVTTRLIAPILSQLVTWTSLIMLLGLALIYLASRILPSASPMFEMLGRMAAVGLFAWLAGLLWRASRTPQQISDAALTASSYFVWKRK